MTIVPLTDELVPALRSFVSTYYSHIPLKADPALFDWRYRRHPLGSALGGYYVAVQDDGAVAGQVASIPDRVCIDGVWTDMSWMVDLAVAPAIRNRHAGLHLMRHAMRVTPVVMASGVCRGLIGMFEALGWKRVRMSEAFYSINRPSGMLKVATQNNDNALPPAAARLAWLANVADLVLPTLQRCSQLFSGSLNVTVEPLDRFGPEIDQFLSTVVPTLGNTTYRSAQLLSWKFDQCPYGDYFGLAAWGDGRRMRGYVVVKMLASGDVKWADIADIVVQGDDAECFDVLVRTARVEAIRRGASFVRFRCSLPGHTGRLQLPLWLKYTRMVVDDVFVYCHDAATLNKIVNGKWHVTGVVADRVDDGRDLEVPK